MPQKTTRRTSTAKKRSTRSTTVDSRRAGSATRARSAAKPSAKSNAKRGINARYPWKEAPNPYLEVRESSIQGKGAFALRNIRKGTRLIEYVGQRISWRTADKRYDDDKMGRHHTFLFTVDDKTCIDAAVNGNDARFLNHSCDGNCEAITDRKRIFLEARKNIRAGEELLYDYQYERTEDHTEEDEKFYACRCGSPNCRGTILAPKKSDA